IEALQETLPELIAVCINATNILNNGSIEDVKVNIPFGEYANPSFESQVETIGKGKTQGIMSIEACVEELYGDSKDEDWKKEEIARIKAEQGIAEVEEPSVNTAMLNMANDTATVSDGE
ncbi:MAG: capsid protein, partial [Lachnospiraceae bacterium]|nr:capsid protein [Lachnospiraceae bacterium]